MNSGGLIKVPYGTSNADLFSMAARSGNRSPNPGRVKVEKASLLLEV